MIAHLGWCEAYGGCDADWATWGFAQLAVICVTVAMVPPDLDLSKRSTAGGLDRQRNPGD